jgi:hypothetical protein
LLVRTEEFENAAWTKSATDITSNASTAPDGTTTADKAIPNTTTSTKRVGSVLTASGTTTWSFSFYAKGDGYSRIGIWDYATSGAYASFLLTGSGSVLDSGSGAAAATITSVGSGWYRCTLRASVTGSVGFGIQILPDSYTTGSINNTWTGNGTSGILVWGAQLETGSTATAYQRVTDQYNVTEAGVPSVSYLFFDGVNDSLATSTITPGVDKAQVFAGVRKLSETDGMIVESSANYNGSVGTFYFASQSSGKFGSASRGDLATSAGQEASISGYTAPVTVVVTATHDIANDLSVMRGNGAAGTNGTADKGPGNFLAYPLYIGHRFNNPPTTASSLFFNGHLYQLIVRFGPNLATGQISSTETWVAGKTGITI